jgi:Asp-tRNA(Asn)/Glu-tRNA(Gln) amidotransferase A subunit family amidase
MARTIGDLDVLDRVMGGEQARQTPLPPGLGVACFEDDGVGAVTPETRDAVRRAARALAAHGFIVEARRPSALDHAAAPWEVFFIETARLLLHETLGGGEDQLPIVRAWLDRGAPETLTAERLIRAWVERDLLAAALADEMSAWPILLCPAAAVPAFPHGERTWEVEGHTVGYLEAMRYTQWFNILGNPAVVVPVGRSADGLPIGVQIVGRPFEDRLVLDVAAVIERECGGYQAPPDPAAAG